MAQAGWEPSAAPEEAVPTEVRRAAVAATTQEEEEEEEAAHPPVVVAVAVAWNRTWSTP